MLETSRSGTIPRALSSVEAPREVVSGPGHKNAYIKYRENDALHTTYTLPHTYVEGIKHGIAKKSEVPLIVFINARSGGGDGPRLAQVLSRALGRAQVFDISEHRPDVVLKKMWSNFQSAENAGDKDATYYRQRLRIIVAGGDGTIAWVLGTIKKLNLQPAPGVAIIPLGTGNDMSRSFGWGGLFLRSSIKNYDQICCMLMRVGCAKPDPLDCWSISVALPNRDFISPMPHCISLVEPKPEHGQQPLAAKGMFWNYLSIGLDAKAAYGFHQLREAHPALTAGRISNQWWYSWFSCTSGWFCGAKPITHKAKLSIIPADGTSWQDVKIRDDIRAIVLLNLQSYAGGRQLWGATPLTRNDLNRGLKEPSYNDGLVEVVGLTNGYHTGMVMATSGHMVHARRICQAAGVRISMRASHTKAGGGYSHCFLQVDGEPWRQSVPNLEADEPLTVEVNHLGTSQLYHNYHDLEPINPKKQRQELLAKIDLTQNMTPDNVTPVNVSRSTSHTGIPTPKAHSPQASVLRPGRDSKVEPSRLGDMSRAGSAAQQLSGHLSQPFGHLNQSPGHSGQFSGHLNGDAAAVLHQAGHAGLTASADNTADLTASADDTADSAGAAVTAGGNATGELQRRHAGPATSTTGEKEEAVACGTLPGSLPAIGRAAEREKHTELVGMKQQGGGRPELHQGSVLQSPDPHSPASGRE
ncbi:ATP-NAD kinase-like domain-containing protein [Dunaliella salina]|uniref:Diacylglycerol kinase n=1 Tax=Dunaliella salina TaxID=3046 RepID=A0ABQ7GEU3_DUNSA|nr:ATP-NAD kinase-like domain-containing protein [Dunaliella salina]|eukprot:KAF5833126.1 ATP-NAD kinase-like domain-containing protein [Dunaliella salina]